MNQVNGRLLINIIDMNGGTLDPDCAIYRIIPRYRLIEILEKKQLTLTHPSMWDDPFENAVLSAELHYGEDIGDLAGICAGVVGQSWSLCPESDALWRIYSHDKSGVRIKSTPKKIFNALVNSKPKKPELYCFVGKVSYQDVSEIWKIHESTSALFTSDGIAKTLLLKRKEFATGEEIRLVYTDGPRQLFMSIDIDPNQLIEEITLDPRATDTNLQMIKAQATQIQYHGVINKSKLYDVPNRLVITLD